MISPIEWMLSLEMLPVGYRPNSGHFEVPGYDTVADIHGLPQKVFMGWIAEFVIQGFWEGAVELAYRKWGWFGGIIAFLLPVGAIAFVVWLLVR